MGTGLATMSDGCAEVSPTRRAREVDGEEGVLEPVGEVARRGWANIVCGRRVEGLISLLRVGGNVLGLDDLGYGVRRGHLLELNGV